MTYRILALGLLLSGPVFAGISESGTASGDLEQLFGEHERPPAMAGGWGCSRGGRAGQLRTIKISVAVVLLLFLILLFRVARREGARAASPPPAPPPVTDYAGGRPPGRPPGLGPTGPPWVLLLMAGAVCLGLALARSSAGLLPAKGPRAGRAAPAESVKTQLETSEKTMGRLRSEGGRFSIDCPGGHWLTAYTAHHDTHLCRQPGQARPITLDVSDRQDMPDDDLALERWFEVTALKMATRHPDARLFEWEEIDHPLRGRSYRFEIRSRAMTLFGHAVWGDETYVAIVATSPNGSGRYSHGDRRAARNRLRDVWRSLELDGP